MTVTSSATAIGRTRIGTATPTPRPRSKTSAHASAHATATAHVTAHAHATAHAVHQAGGGSTGTAVLAAIIALLVGLLAGYLFHAATARRAVAPARPAPRRVAVPGQRPAPHTSPRRSPQTGPDQPGGGPAPRAPVATPPVATAPVTTAPVTTAPVTTAPVTASTGPSATGSSATGSSATGIADLTADRDSLVNACIRARDMISSGAVRQALGDALAQAGVAEIDPTGQPFDPDRHCSVGVLHAPSPGLDETVARAERVGYSDRGRQLRLPEVIVYTAGDAAGGWQ